MARVNYSKCGLLLVLVLCSLKETFSEENGADAEVKENESKSEEIKIPETETAHSKHSVLNKYKWKFTQYRQIQQHAMQAVFDKANHKNQVSNLVESVLTKLFDVMLDARANLTKVGYVAGDEFPEEEMTRESLSKVLENTFIFADTLLRRPKLVHAKYDTHTEWRSTLEWGYYISVNAGVVSDVELTYLDLMAKEAGILPKDANFVNPYLDDSEKPRKKFEDPKPAEKKKRKKIQRGPRMAHSEL